MKKRYIPLLALSVAACQSMMNKATCYYFLKPGVTQEVCQAILPVLQENGLDTSDKIKAYGNFLKKDLPANKWQYAIQFATGSATGQTKTYLETTKDAVVALTDLAAKQEDPLKFSADLYSNAVELGTIFK